MGHSAEYLADLRKRRRFRPGTREMPAPEVMPAWTANDILDWYERGRGDAWHQIEMPVTKAAIALLTGLDPVRVEDIVDRNIDLSATRAAKFTQIIDDVENRRVVWGVLETIIGKGRGRTAAVYVDPPSPKINYGLFRVSPRSTWSPHAHCVHCGSRKWLAIDYDGKPQIACYTCLPPSQYASLGFVASKKPLIREFVRSRHD